MPEIVQPLVANLALASLLWIYSLWRADVSLIDLLWPLFFVLAAWLWFDVASASLKDWAALAAIMAWGARLHIHLATRNLGHGEDRRYQKIRQNNSPGFWWKSLLIVFALQALLAWLISLVIYGAFHSAQPGALQFAVALVLVVTGFVFEAAGDWQLARFVADPNNAGRVMNRGLWRCTRHPNYFGEACFWWGIYIFAAGPGTWWTILSPLLITFLLLRVSGVSLLEKDIGERRPEYSLYVKSTPAFIPSVRCLFGGKA